MKKPLVITGWGIDYACAAALATLKLGDVELVGLSKRRLPDYLAELAGDTKSTQGLESIDILGVYLLNNAPGVISSLKKLKKSVPAIRWTSFHPLPENAPNEMSKLVDVFVSNNPLSLTETVGERFSREIPQEELKRIYGTLRVGAAKRKRDADLAWVKLFDVAMHRYRCFQDWTAYPEAIKLLARGGAKTELMKKHETLYDLYGHREFKGISNATKEIWEKTNLIGKKGASRVLITGETGTGKETVAYLIHGKSDRAEGPFIAFNCADLSPQLIESRLFGHEKGAFTGAASRRKGAFELADGGSLFLDEVGDLPLDAQAGVLRVLQEGRFFRIGGEEEIDVDVRIISATNRDIMSMTREGTFREDLLYRLFVTGIHVPPLRERPEDIKQIANDYLMRRGLRRLDEASVEALQAHDWPGNVRELQNVLERAIVMGENNYGKIIAEHAKLFPVNEVPKSDLLDDVVKTHVAKVLKKHDGNKTRARKALGISFNTLQKHLKSKV